MLCFLYKVFKIDGVIKAIQTVEFNNLDDQVFYTVQFGHFYDYKTEVEKRSNGENIQFDFDIKNNFQIEYSHSVREIEVPNESLLPAESSCRLESLDSLYDLLRDLANNDCCYVTDADKITDGGVGMLTSFKNLVVSESTMTVCISIKDENDNWKSRPIIKIDEDSGRLSQLGFIIAIPNEKVRKFEKYNLKFIKKVKFNNVYYSIVEYLCDLQICNSTSNLAFCEPLIVHYCYLNNLYKWVIKVLSRYQKDYLSFDVPSDKVTAPRKRGLMGRQGVYLKLKDVPRGVNENVNAAILAAYELSSKVSSINFGVVNEYVKMKGLHKDLTLAIIILANIMKSKDKYEMVELCVKELHEYKWIHLNISLYLYNVRVTCMYYPTVLMSYQQYVEFPIEGALCNRSVTVKII